MSRLPVPGSDIGVWGNVLNDFLQAEHNTDGTLKIRTDGSVVLTGGTQTVNGVKTFTSAPIVPAPSSGTEAANKTYVDARMNFRGAWAASTAYAVNDVVTLGGEVLLTATAHTSGASFSLTNWTHLTFKRGRYNVMLYGAKGDGSTNDTTAINAAVTAAYNAGIADGTNYAEIYFPPAVYVVSSATTKGGSTQGNAQIPLPNVASTDEKFVLAFIGGEGSTSWVHWQQTVAQNSGAVIKTTLTGLSVDGTWGAPSVIGGPTVAQGSGIFSNMRVVMRGITVTAPYNPGIIAMDFRYLAQAEIISAAALADAPAVGSPSITTLPSNDLGIGLRMPQNGNNDCAYIVDYGCEGFYYGMSFGEHLTALRLGLVYVQVGIFIATGGGSFHGASITNLSVELAAIAIQISGTPGSTFPLDVSQMGVESIGTYDVDDTNNILRGSINWSNTNSSGTLTPLLHSAAGIKILAVNPAGKPGNATAPSVPSSTVALVNPFWRDAAVVVTGGTVTVIAVDGVTTGLTSGLVMVPSGKTITLTYSSGPSWTWTLL